MAEFSNKICSLKSSSKEGSITKADLEKLANNLHIHHNKKIKKEDLCNLVHKRLQKMGQLSNWQAYLTQKAPTPPSSQISLPPKKSPKAKTSKKNSPKKNKGSVSTIHSSFIAPLKEKFSERKCTRGALLEYKLEDVRRLASNMNIPLHRLSKTTGNKVLMPKKELCTAIKAKFNSHYEKGEKYHWKDIQNGLRRPRRKNPDSEGRYYSNLLIEDNPKKKKSPKPPKAPKPPKPPKEPKPPKKINLKPIPFTENPNIKVRSSASSMIDIESGQAQTNYDNLKLIAKKLNVNLKHSNGTDRTEEELDYYIKQKYAELNKLLNLVY